MCLLESTLIYALTCLRPSSEYLFVRILVGGRFGRDAWGVADVLRYLLLLY